MEIRKTLAQIGICLIIIGIIGFVMAYIYIFEPVLKISQITSDWFLIYAADLKEGVTDIDWDEIVGGVELYIILFIVAYISTRPVNDVLFLGIARVEIPDLVILLIMILGIGVTLTLIQLLSKTTPSTMKPSPIVDKLKLSEQKNYKLLLGTIGSLVFSIPMMFLVLAENFAPGILPSYIEYIIIYVIMGIGLIILSAGFTQWKDNHKIFSIITTVMSFIVFLLLFGHYLEKNYLYNKYYWSLEGFMGGPLSSFMYNSRLIAPYIALLLAVLLIAGITIIYGYKSFNTKGSTKTKRIAQISGVLIIEWGIITFLLTLIYTTTKIDDLMIGIRNSQLALFDYFSASVINYYMMFIGGLRTETLYDYLYIAGFFPLAVLIVIYGITYILEIKQSPITTKNVGEKK
ncbi:MAG: hypothetical protein ACFFDN_17190 [Candidatus Hodarchaeota archaeon]